jgi:gamma-glutamylcysteine synthetase
LLSTPLFKAASVCAVVAFYAALLAQRAAFQSSQNPTAWWRFTAHCALWCLRAFSQRSTRSTHGAKTIAGVHRHKHANAGHFWESVGNGFFISRFFLLLFFLD